MKLAVLGATGAVGQTMLRVLEERGFPAEEIVPLASERSEGRRLEWRGREWRVRRPGADAFRGCQLALFSAGAARSREWAPVAAAEGAVVVDNSSAWRMDPEVPLVVPEVNGERIGERPRGIIANPNCVVTQLVLALEALRRAAGLRRVWASTYQSVSGAGAHGVAALRTELDGAATAEASPFPVPVADNVLPPIGPAVAGGWPEDEDKIRHVAGKILDLPGLAVGAACGGVPGAHRGQRHPVHRAGRRGRLDGRGGKDPQRGEKDPRPPRTRGRCDVRPRTGRDRTRRCRGRRTGAGAVGGGGARGARGDAGRGGRGGPLGARAPRRRRAGHRARGPAAQRPRRSPDPAPVARGRQPAQGRRAQRGPDRRARGPWLGGVDDVGERAARGRGAGARGWKRARAAWSTGGMRAGRPTSS